MSLHWFRHRHHYHSRRCKRQGLKPVEIILNVVANNQLSHKHTHIHPVRRIMERKHICVLTLILGLLIFKLNIFTATGDQDEDIPHNE